MPPLASFSLSLALQEKRKAEELNREARRKLEDYRVPDVSHWEQI